MSTTTALTEDTIKHSLREALEGEPVLLDINGSAGSELVAPTTGEIERLVSLLAPVVRGEVVAEIDYLIERLEQPEVLERAHQLNSPAATLGYVVGILRLARAGREVPPSA